MLPFPATTFQSAILGGLPCPAWLPVPAVGGWPLGPAPRSRRTVGALPHQAQPRVCSKWGFIIRLEGGSTESGELWGPWSVIPAPLTSVLQAAELEPGPSHLW